MGFYATKIGDAEILLEAMASGAFAKSDLDIKPDPKAAVVNAVGIVKTVAGYMAQEVAPILRSTGALLEVNFSVRADGNGMVMICEDASQGQFQCSLKFAPPRPAPPPPPRRPA